MKFLKLTLLLLAVGIFTSCSSDDDKGQAQPMDETEGLLLTKIIDNQTHEIAIYTVDGKFTEGYNKVYFQLKDNSGSLQTDVVFGWMPMMYMESMEHGAPYSEIQKVSGKSTLYEAWVVFQMAGNADEYWELSFDYLTGGGSFHASDIIDVESSELRRVTVFMGSDGGHYVLALVEPTEAEVALNDMSAGLFRMSSMHEFETVNNYRVLIDPRMPGMGNHGSPNNEHLTQGADGFYHGKLSLTMTGYWLINLMVENQDGAVVKGEAVTESHPQSSIYFEIEF